MNALDSTCGGPALPLRRQLLAAVPAAALASLTPAAAWAQADYPNRPLRVIVPQPPGGGFDFVGRALADRLAQPLGQPVVVENRTGAAGGVGTMAVARSPADGASRTTARRP